MHNLSLAVSPGLEESFIKYLQDQTLKHSNLSNKELRGVNINAIKIEERKLTVSMNNTWMDLERNTATVVFDEPDARGICKKTSTLEFPGYYVHSLIAFQIKVEYTSTIPTRPNPR